MATFVDPLVTGRRDPDRPAGGAGRPGDRCAHEDPEYIGNGGRTEYWRCRACGSILVAQDGRVWRLRASKD